MTAAATIRTLIADLKAGNLVRREDAVAEERAKVVAFIERYPTNNEANPPEREGEGSSASGEGWGGA